MPTTVCLTFDFDALSLWIGTFRTTSATPLSRGEYGARVGLERILMLLEEHGIKATFFIPGHTVRTFPGAVRQVAAAGHEIAAHNDVHETPVGLARDQEVAILDRAEATLADITGVRPVGYRSPAWDLSASTIQLLAERGYSYDSSMMADDFRPYRPRLSIAVGQAGEVSFGEEAPLWEFPVAWELDDFPYFHFAPKFPGLGLRSPQEVGQIWLREFEFCHRHVKDGVFTLTMHPEIIGRGPRMEMLAELITAIRLSEDVVFSVLRDAALELTANQRAN